MLESGYQKSRIRLIALTPRTRLGRFISWASFIGIMGIIGGGVFFGALYLYYAPTLPHFETLADYQPSIGTRIYSADNQLIAEFAEERRVLVPFERIPPQLFHAFMSAEDKRFYQHPGIDFLGIAQAIFDKLRKPKSKLRGASTITQQVAKSLLATHESYAEATTRSFRRKIREALLAWRLEQSLTKNDILYMYVNQIFLGHKAYGVQAAAEHYFQKNVWELNLAEMATLAGLPQRPSAYSPFSRPAAAMARREYVLGRMLKDGYISQRQYDTALNEQIVVYPRRELYLQIAPYFAEQVRRELVERYGKRAVLEEGFRVYATVDLGLQHRGQQAVRRGLMALDKRQGYRGALANLPETQWPSFVTAYRQELELEENEEMVTRVGDRYLAVVTSIGPKGGLAKLNIGGKEGFLPLAAMRWARRPNPTKLLEYHYLNDIRRMLKVGDIIAVRHSTRRKISQAPGAIDTLDSIPKDHDEELFEIDQEPVAQASLMSVDPSSGYVVAQIGGYHFENSSFNRATQACREPGSSFKPIVYSAAIDKLDYTASTLIDDKPLVFDDPENEARWKPNNAGMKFRGSLPMRTCLMDSINTPAIRIASAVGIDDLTQNARNLGLTTPLKRELGIALGSSCTTLRDLITVYTTLANYGKRRDIHFIRRVVDRYGNVLEDHSDPEDATLDLATHLDRAYDKLVRPRQKALDEQTAFLTISLMENVIANGTGIGASRLGTAVAGKTGTTDDSYDAWFMAFTPKLVSGVWVGHDRKERPLGIREQGGRTALPIWVDYMYGALRDYRSSPSKRVSHGEFQPPAGVVQANIDPETGLLARPDMPSATEWYRSGTEPSDLAPDKSVYNPDLSDPYGIDPG